MDVKVHPRLAVDAISDDAPADAGHGDFARGIRWRERGGEVDAAGGGVHAVGLNAVMANGVRLRGQPALDVLPLPSAVAGVVPVDRGELGGRNGVDFRGGRNRR